MHKKLETIYAPDQAPRQLAKINTLPKAINSGLPTLGKLQKTLSRRKIEAYIKLWFIDLNDILELKKPLSERQIDDLAWRILENYKNLNLADINRIFERAKNGYYGDMYDRLTIPGVMKWFNLYFEERCLTAADINRRQSEGSKHPFPNTQRGKEIQKADFKKASEYHKRHKTQQAIDKAKKKMK